METPFHLWHLGSYTLEKNYNPEKLTRLYSILFSEENQPKDPSLCEFIRNMLVKYGFMSYSRDQLSETIQGKQIPTNYHLTNFIFYSKAFLDAVANIVNYFYDMRFEKAQIDFKQTKFQNKLKEKSPKFHAFVEKESIWLKDVVFWRDEIVHKKSPLVINYSMPDETGKNPASNIVKMPFLPLTLFNFALEVTKIKSQNGGIVEQDILPFCDAWLTKSDELICEMCNSLLESLDKN